MFQARMLTQNEFSSFFNEYQIPWRGKYQPPEDKLDEIFLKAYAMSKAFAAFILYGLLGSDRSSILTNFKDSDDAYVCYAHFMIGYTGQGNNSN